MLKLLLLLFASRLRARCSKQRWYLRIKTTTVTSFHRFIVSTHTKVNSFPYYLSVDIFLCMSSALSPKCRILVLRSFLPVNLLCVSCRAIWADMHKRRTNILRWSWNKSALVLVERIQEESVSCIAARPPSKRQEWTQYMNSAFRLWFLCHSNVIFILVNSF